MNRHNGFVTCMRCKCVTRQSKTHRSPAPVGEYRPRWEHDRRADGDQFYCQNDAKCAHQRKIKTERDRRLHAALQAQHDRDVDRQMGYEMKAYFTGMS